MRERPQLIFRTLRNLNRKETPLIQWFQKRLSLSLSGLGQVCVHNQSLKGWNALMFPGLGCVLVQVPPEVDLSQGYL